MARYEIKTPTSKSTVRTYRITTHDYDLGRDVNVWQAKDSQTRVIAAGATESDAFDNLWNYLAQKRKSPAVAELRLGLD